MVSKQAKGMNSTVVWTDKSLHLVADSISLQSLRAPNFGLWKVKPATSPALFYFILFYLIIFFGGWTKLSGCTFLGVSCHGREKTKVCDSHTSPIRLGQPNDLQLIFLTLQSQMQIGRKGTVGEQL